MAQHLCSAAQTQPLTNHYIRPTLSARNDYADEQVRSLRASQKGSEWKPLRSAFLHKKHNEGCVVLENGGLYHFEP